MTTYLNKLGNNLYSAATTAASCVASGTQHLVEKTYSMGCQAIEKSGQALSTAADLGKRAVSKAVETLGDSAAKVGRLAHTAYSVVQAYRHPQETVEAALRDSLHTFDLAKTLSTPYSAKAKKRINLFFGHFRKEHKGLLKEKAFNRTQKKIVAAYSEKEIQAIASKLPFVVTEENARKLASSVFDACSKMIQSVAFVREHTDKAHIKEELLKRLATPLSGKTATFEEETKNTQKRVHANLVTLLGTYRKKAKIFTLKHLVACVVYIAVKFFGYRYESTALRGALALLLEELKGRSELYEKIEGCSEFLMLKFLEQVTTGLLNPEYVNSEKVDENWEKLVSEASSSLSHLLSSSHRPFFTKRILPHLLPLPASALFEVRPSKLISPLVEGIRSAAERCLQKKP